MFDAAERLSRVLAALRTGDPDGAVDLFHPDATWYGSVGGLEPGLARGRDEVVASFNAYRRTWEELSFEVRAIVADGDRALALAVERGRGSGSGVEVEQVAVMTATFRDGLVVDVVSYLDRPRGFADFGLDEEQARVLEEEGGFFDLVDGRLVRRR